MEQRLSWSLKNKQECIAPQGALLSKEESSVPVPRLS